MVQDLGQSLHAKRPEEDYSIRSLPRLLLSLAGSNSGPCCGLGCPLVSSSVAVPSTENRTEVQPLKPSGRALLYKLRKPAIIILLASDLLWSTKI